MLDAPALEGFELFTGLTEQQLQLLTPFARQENVAPGTVFSREGQRAQFLYLVEQGRVALELAVSRPDGGHTRPTVLAILGPGQALGWSALVEPFILTASARALDPCRLVALEAAPLREALSRYPDVGYLLLSNLSKVLAERLAQTRQTLIYERGWAMVG